MNGPYSEGRDDFENNEHENPYCMLTQKKEHAEWLEGYKDAREKYWASFGF